MSWFEKIMPSRIKTERRTRSVPEGLWIKCPACDAVLYRAELERNLYVCPKCSHHMRMGARERLERFLDPGTTAEIGASISPEDPLKFRDSKRYRERLAQAQKATGESDALVVLAGTLHALPIVACAFEFQFLAGSLGSVGGERFWRVAAGGPPAERIPARAGGHRHDGRPPRDARPHRGAAAAAAEAAGRCGLTRARRSEGPQADAYARRVARAAGVGASQEHRPGAHARRRRRARLADRRAGIPGHHRGRHPRQGPHRGASRRAARRAPGLAPP